MRGLGEKFAPDLHTGTGNFTVPLAPPAGRNGFQPQLALAYSTGAGNGLFGLGWRLGVAGIVRKTSHGLPRYRDDAADPSARDVFILSGAEDLVFVGPFADENGAAAERYRPRTEGLFAEILRYRRATDGTDYWRIRTKDGLVSTYGTNPAAGARPRYPAGETDAGDRAIVHRPDRLTDIFAWHLTLTEDPFGNRIEYLYGADAGAGDGHSWRQPLLREIRYADFGDRATPQFLVTVRFEYGPRPDAFSDRRPGFELRTTRRCRAIQTTTHAGRDRPVRRYEFTYGDDPRTRVSLLSAIDVVGFDDDGAPSRELPPLEFRYSRFRPEDRAHRDFYPLPAANLPASALNSPALELVDLFGRGLPDIVEMNGSARFWRNRGGGEFAPPRTMASAPPVSFAGPGVQLVDANGDGRTDLLVTQGPLSGYFPLRFTGEWDQRSFQKHALAPSFDLKDDEAHLVDLTGDGVTDVLRSGTRFECFFNDPRHGWRPENVRHFARQPLDVFPNVAFSDPRVKWADFTGDGLQDLALVHDGNVEYWPNLGYGHWGERLHLRNSPRFPAGYDPRRILLGDVNGDDLADLVYVDDRTVTLWLNQSGNAWSDPIEIPGTPPVSDVTSIRLVDLLGSSIAGLLWTRDARTAGEEHYFFLDLTGATKPYLLTEVCNNLGAVTRVDYAPSTRFFLEDERRPDTRWRTTLPFPVQVVARTEVVDELSGGKLTTEYRYHHGYWDGIEREFRGFGFVEQSDSESFERHGDAALPGGPPALAAVDPQYFSPPTFTRTWFHLGPVGDDATNWREMDWSDAFWSGDAPMLEQVGTIDAALADLRARHGGLTSRALRRRQRDALRSLRGSVLRTEVYALDGTIRASRPFTVSEHAYGIREENEAAAGEDAPGVFFPHALAQRTTEWERGDDPKTSFAYTRDYDAFGQARVQVQIACPRGWRRPADARPGDSYLATVTRVTVATPPSAATYIQDRIAKSTRHEILGAPPGGGPAPSRTVAEVLALAESPAQLRLLSESLNFFDDDPAQPDRGAFVGRPFGVIGRYGTIVRAETLVLTAELLAAAYGATPPAYFEPGLPFTGGGAYPAGFAQALPALAGYTQHPAGVPYAGGYYVTSERSRFDFHGPGGVARGLVRERRDALGATTLLKYDQPYAFRPVTVVDALHLRLEAELNYRVLQPQVLTEANGNRSRVDFSPLGLVTASWVMGKPGQVEGDVARPGTVLRYDFRAFFEGRRANPPQLRPIFTRTVRSVRHDSDPEDQGETIEERQYSDGFGRLLQTRVQGDRWRFGDPTFGGGEDVLPARQADGAGGTVVGSENMAATAPNVTVSGAQRYDNKGRVVESFEPFFSRGWDYAPPREGDAVTPGEFGARTRQFYDSLGRLVRSRDASGAERHIIHGVPQDLAAPDDPEQVTPTPWEIYTYDANDNAGRTHAAGTLDARHHWNTPASAEFDALGREVLTVSRTREPPAGPAAPLPAPTRYVARSRHDIEGRLQRWTDRLNRPALEYVYDLAGNVIRLSSLDAGERCLVYNALGQEIERWDGRGARILQAYDAAHRAQRTWARNGPGAPLTLRQEISYGDGGTPQQSPALRAAARSANQLGKPVLHRDEAGELRITRYDFHGRELARARAVVADAPLLAALNATTSLAPVFVIDWEQPPPLDAGLETDTSYDALGRVTAVRCPLDAGGGRKTLRPGYDTSGALQRLAVDGTSCVERIARNARGQPVLIVYGNGLMRRFAYHPATFRLARARTSAFQRTGPAGYRPDGPPLQDAAYTYDPAGNLREIVEQAPGCGVRNSPAVAGHPELTVTLAAGDALLRRFDYDPLYRLTRATGREAHSLPANGTIPDETSRSGFNWGRPGSPTPSTARDRTRRYTETYAYDAADNLLEIAHGTWKRRFGFSGFTPAAWQQQWPAHLDPATAWTAPASNRLTHVLRGTGTAPASQFFDAVGNRIREDTSRHFAWDAFDRLAGFAIRANAGAPSVAACYLYDAAGHRTKKLVRKGATVETTVSLDGGFEQRTSGATANTLLRVTTDAGGAIFVRAGPALAGETGPAVQYHLADHLGSSHLVVGGDSLAARGFVNREEYFPHGETSFGSYGRKRYRFMGRERDEESGLSHHGARYYAPHLGRWTSADPAGPADHGNLYVAFRNSPLLFADTSGLGSEVENGTASDAGVGNVGGGMSASKGPSGYSDTTAQGEKLPGGVEFHANFTPPPSRPRLMWDNKEGVCHEQDGTYFDNSVFAMRREAQAELKQQDERRRKFAQELAVRRGEVPVMRSANPVTAGDDPFLRQMQRTGQYDAILSFGLLPYGQARLGALLLGGSAEAGAVKGALTPRVGATGSMAALDAEALGGQRIFLVGEEGAASTRAIRINGNQITYDTLAPAKQGMVRADMKAIRNIIGEEADWWTGTHGNPAGQFGGGHLEYRFFQRESGFGRAYGYKVRDVAGVSQSTVLAPPTRPTVYSWCYSSAAFLP